jgi:protein-tyrosine-phosphatase
VETPLFICYAKCCRSVLAYYLYRHLHADDPALSAGHWGINASGHCPRQVDRELCDQASAIFVMAPAHLRHLLRLYGEYLDRKTYLFADPFIQPQSFHHGECKVYDPSFDDRPVEELVHACRWMRERVQQIGLALRSTGNTLVAASQYLPLIETVDPDDI